MENNNNNNKQPTRWRDVVLTPDMPLNVLVHFLNDIVHFLNAINQRLCTIEDATTVDGKTLTEIYAEEAAQEVQ